MNTNQQTLIDFVKKRGIVRSREITSLGIPRVLLTRLVQSGEIQRIAKGLYSLPDRDITDKSILAEIALKYPSGIVCLLSALRFHEVTTQTPYEVWFGIPNKSRIPQIDYPPIRGIRFSHTGLTEGVDPYVIENIPVNITNVARTVVDCFKFRNKIGLDIAMEALREAWQGKLCTIDELWHYAQLFRVTNIMRPYLESVTQ